MCIYTQKDAIGQPGRCWWVVRLGGLHALTWVPLTSMCTGQTASSAARSTQQPSSQGSRMHSHLQHMYATNKPTHTHTDNTHE